MSHFSVLVVTNERPAKDAMQEILLPWHEYECTGIKRFLQWVDHTDEVTVEYNTPCDAVRGPDGSVYQGYEDIFYREPTTDETRRIGPIAGTGAGDGMSWTSKDWKDGRGYRTKVHFMPDGFVATQAPRSAFHESLAAFATEYHGYTVRKDGRIGRKTNPHAKWDWWQVGGRYSGKLHVKQGAAAFTGERSWTNAKEAIAGVDQARRDDIDLDAMKREQIDHRREWAADCCVKAKLTLADLDVACRLHHDVHAEWLALTEPKPRGQAYYEWIESHSGDWTIAAQFSRACFDIPKPPPNQSLAEWIKDAPAISSWAVVMDNQWFEKGKMGWWGMSSDDNRDWESHFNDLFGLIRSEQWVTIVDCHI